MWLWYLELYLLIVLAFAAGTAVGLGLVRLVVRRHVDEPGLLYSEADATGASATRAGSAT